MQILIPSSIKTSQTELRWRQASVTANTDWSIDNVYVGLRCPKNCHGHGRCTESRNQTVVCGGTADGESCVFPFSRNGTAYNACTGDYREGELWCSTTANYDQDGKWGYCVCGQLRFRRRESATDYFIYLFRYLCLRFGLFWKSVPDSLHADASVFQGNVRGRFVKFEVGVGWRSNDWDDVRRRFVGQSWNIQVRAAAGEKCVFTCLSCIVSAVHAFWRRSTWI